MILLDTYFVEPEYLNYFDFLLFVLLMPGFYLVILIVSLIIPILRMKPWYLYVLFLPFLAIVSITLYANVFMPLMNFHPDIFGKITGFRDTSAPKNCMFLSFLLSYLCYYFAIVLPLKIRQKRS